MTFPIIRFAACTGKSDQGPGADTTRMAGVSVGDRSAPLTTLSIIPRRTRRVTGTPVSIKDGRNLRRLSARG
jgi:hypothetical protein